MARLPQPGGDSGNWGDILNEYLSVIHDEAGKIKPGAVTKSDVGLGNVNNTSDANKPISAAAQAALDDKVGTAEVDAAVTDILLDPDSEARAATDDLYQQKGDTGSAATVAIGTVDTVPDGSPAAVTNSGTSTAAVLDFDIPAGPTGAAGAKGDQGDPGEAGAAGADGAAATIAVGTVGTVPDGDPATVTNAGTPSAAVFDFEIPAGPTGATGADGPAGPKGDQGDAGATGATGAPGSAATVSVGTVDTVPDGDPATITNSGTSSAAVLDFEIPAGPAGATGAAGAAGAQGDPGEDGAAATIAVGTVGTVSDSDPATIVNSGTANAAVFDFEIPAGPVGPAGPAGAAGIQGDPGEDGAAATIAVGTVDTVSEGDPATVTNSGTSSAAILDFEIPTGPQGETGVGTAGPPGPLGNTIVNTLSGGVFTLNPFNGTEYTLTIIDDTTLAASGLTNGAAMTVTIVQDGVGGHALTLPSSWIGATDFTLATAPGEYDIIVVWRSPLGYHVKRVHTGELPSDLWTPQQLANQICWYNGDSIAAEAGDLISSWENSWTAQPAMNSGVAPTAGNPPPLRIFNGVKYLELQAASQHCLATNFAAPTSYAQPMTLAVIVRSTGNGTQRIFDGNVTFINTSPELSMRDSPQNWYANNSDANSLTTNGDFQSVVYQANGASSTLRVDGTQAAVSLGSLSLAGARVGGSPSTTFNSADIAEIIIFNHLPSAPELATLETYLNTKRDLLNGVG